MIFSDKQWSIIKEANIFFRSAFLNKCIINPNNFITNIIIQIYEEATGNELDKDLSKPGQTLKVYEKIGEAYFSDLKEREIYDLQ
jgi:hypothetical protein